MENSLEESEVYTPTHVDEIKSSSENVPNEPIKTDLKTILTEDMAMIRGSSREKNIFRKNVKAIRTLHDIDDAEINIQGFEDTRYMNNFFDIAVDNVPFGNYRVNDTGYNQHSFLARLLSAYHQSFLLAHQLA